MFIKQFDQLGEIGEGAGETVDLIDHDNGDLAGPDIGQELLQGRAVEGGSGEGVSSQLQLEIVESNFARALRT